MHQTSLARARLLGAILATTLAAVTIVAIPASATPALPTFDDGTFVYAYDSADIGSGATIEDYLGSDTVLTLPAAVLIGGVTYAVTAIGDSAFSGNALTSVTIPDSVTTIGDYAFSDNTLTSVTISNSITSISDYAFYNNQLTSIIIPTSVTSIGDSAFAKNALTSLTIPTSVTHIGAAAFYSNVLVSVTIPNSITVIDSEVFSFNVLTSVTIPDSVTLIRKSAFASNNITSLTIPNSVTYIENSAFSNNDLTSLTLPNSITSLGNGIFSDNNLTSVTIPDSVTSIGEKAFFNNSLTSIDLPDTLTIIKDSAFENNNLASVTIPASVIAICAKAFNNNPLEEVLMEGPVPSTYVSSLAFGVGSGSRPLVMYYDRYAASGYTSPTWTTAGGDTYSSQGFATVVFDTGIGASDSFEDAVVRYTIPAPARPTAVAYRFLGWFTAATGGTAVTFPYRVLGDTTLYAQWEARVVSSPTSADAGATITITGSGFEPGESVQIWIHSDPVLLTTVTASGTGTLSTTVVIPISSPSGLHDLVFTGSVSGSTSQGITIRGRSLAATGLGTGPLVGASLLLLLTGLGLILAGRRTRRTHA